MKPALILLLVCSLALAGCAQRTERYGAVGSLPDGADAASVKLVHIGAKVNLVVDLKGAHLTGKELVGLCEIAHFDGSGHASRGASAKISSSGRATLHLSDRAFDQQLWAHGGSCTLLVSGSSDVPTSVSFAGN